MKKPIRVLYSYGVYEKFEEELRIVEDFSEGKYKITPMNHRKFLGWKSDVSPYELDDYYRNGHDGLKKLYEYVNQLCNDIDVFYVDHECVYHPDFILELSNKVYTVICSGDDPESSYRRSKPYLYAFDHAFCYAVFHNEKQRMTDKFIEWGAKKSDFRPHGCWENQYDHSLTEEAILSEERDVDLIFVGGMASKRRNVFLLNLKKRMGSRFKLYGNWGGVIGLLSRLKHGYGLMPIKKISNLDLLSYYRRAKLGINIHQSYGPCNLRLYELPMNGIMQICDNKQGLGDVYEDGKEIVAYNNFNEAVDLIQYYLDHDSERRQIALNGYLKTKEKYLFRTTFYDSMKKIEAGMLEKKNKISN